MKILILSHYFASHRGGIETAAEEQFRALAARGQEVAWLAADSTPGPASTGRSHAIPLPVCNFVEQKTGLPLPIPALGAFKEISRELSTADILILHDCLYLTNMFAFVLARLRKLPVIVNQHLAAVPYRRALLKTAMQVANAIVTRPMLSNATQVIFESEIPKISFGALRYKSPPKVLFNGVDADLFRTCVQREERELLRQRYSLPLDRPIILFVGRFVEKKGMHSLKCMAALKPGYTWAFAGWGPLDPRSWNAANVRVFYGLRGESLAALYRACDVLVLPSTGEGFPLVMQEALASGLPVVCNRETLMADPELSKFATGVPVYVGDDERTAREFLAGVERVFNSGMQAQYHAEQRRAFAISRYSWRRTAERYLEIASRLVRASQLQLPTAGSSEEASP